MEIRVLKYFAIQFQREWKYIMSERYVLTDALKITFTQFAVKSLSDFVCSNNGVLDTQIFVTEAVAVA